MKRRSSNRELIAERDRASSVAAVARAELAAVRTLAEGMSDYGIETEVRDFGDDILRAINAPIPRAERAAS